MNVSANVGGGSSFIARLDVKDIMLFDAANYDLLFNSSVLVVLDVTDGLIGSDIVPVDMWGVVAPGTVRTINNVPGLSGVSGSGYPAEINFSVIGSAGDSSDLNFTNYVLSNITAEEIFATWVDGSVDVV